MRSIKARRTVKPLCLAGVVFIALAAVRSVGWLHNLELQGYDAVLPLARVDKVRTSEIVIVGISESDIAHYGWPLTDDLLTRLLENLVAQQPVAIGLDLFRDVAVPEPALAANTDRPSFAELLARHDEVIAITAFANAAGQQIRPPAAIAGDPTRFGFADVTLDPDGIVRRGLLYLDVAEGNNPSGEIQASLALRLALRFLRPQGIVEKPDSLHPALLRLGHAKFVPVEGNDGPYVDLDPGGYQYMLTFPLALDQVEILPIDAVLSNDPSLKVVDGKIVLIGTTADSVKDLFFAPPLGTRRTDRVIFGVELHAQMTSQLIRQALGQAEVIRFVPASGETAWIGVWCVVGAVLALTFRSLLSGFAAVIASSGMLVAAAALAFINGIWLPLVPPLIGLFMSTGVVLASLFIQEQKAKRDLMGLFGAHVSHPLAEYLWAERDSFVEDGLPRPQEQVVTVLFSDIRGFTTIAEQLSPRTLVAWLNEYIQAMTEVILDRDGIVYQFTGDGIVAAFGVPVPRVTSAEIAKTANAAVASALAMDAALQRLNKTWRQRGLPAIRIRVGINTGPLIVGSLGTRKRLQYSMIGDTINTAARLESYDKHMATTPDSSTCRILVSASTRQCLGDEYDLSFVGNIHFKGKSVEVPVYHINGYAEGEAAEKTTE